MKWDSTFAYTKALSKHDKNTIYTIGTFSISEIIYWFFVNIVY